MSVAHLQDLSQTKRRLLEKLARGEFQQRETSPQATSSERENDLASLSQEQVWRHARENPSIPQLYNESITIHRTGMLDEGALEDALAEVLRRHEAWRTTFVMKDGKLHQVVHDEWTSFPLTKLDLRHLQSHERELTAVRAADEQARQPFDLGRGPLVRGLLVSLTNEQHRLYVDMHQIIGDGISVYDVLPTELSSAYESLLANTPVRLPALSRQFKEFSTWQRNWLEQGEWQNQLEYWRQQFMHGIPPSLNWPKDRPRPAAATHRGAVVPFSVSWKSLEAVDAVRREVQVSLFAALLAGLAALLYSYTKQNEIVVGSLAPCGRHRSEFSKLLGYFMNPVALRLRIAETDTFQELARKAQEVIVGAISHGDIPFEDVVQELAVPPDPTRHPLFQVAISLAPARASLPNGWDMTPTDVESGGARWDMYLELSERPEYLLGRAQYNPDLFDVAGIVSFLRDLEHILIAAGKNAHLPVSTF